MNLCKAHGLYTRIQVSPPEYVEISIIFYSWCRFISNGWHVYFALGNENEENNIPTFIRCNSVFSVVFIILHSLPFIYNWRPKIS